MSPKSDVLLGAAYAAAEFRLGRWGDAEAAAVASGSLCTAGVSFALTCCWGLP